MKKKLVLIKSFRSKITIVLVLFMCLSAAIANLAIYRYTINSQFSQMREKLMVIAQTAAMTIDPDMLLQIPLNASGVNSSAYKTVEKKLFRIKEVAPSLAYVYILKRGDEPRVLKFIIDVYFNSYKTGLKVALPGEPYPAKDYIELLSAFFTPSADRKVLSDKWGGFLSGYAPIFDRRGEPFAILGVDVSAEEIYRIQRDITARAVLILIFGIAFSALLGLVISNTVTSSVKRLVSGTRHIASGDLRYHMKVESDDEIGELASAFNRMGSSLYKARQELFDYFYHIVESLVRALEARDHYTKGHSDRVAEYSEKIARQMGLPEDRVKLLREAALLHDIGKLGVQDMVLTKKTLLTEDDWREMHKHPEIGEDILKPVSINKDLLAVVKEHHERYDGKGYPDGLKGDRINELAAIVAVADAYDAMTSDRAYRKSLPRSAAIEQLKLNSGVQFDPRVVEAFVKIFSLNDKKL